MNHLWGAKKFLLTVFEPRRPFRISDLQQSTDQETVPGTVPEISRTKRSKKESASAED